MFKPERKVLILILLIAFSTFAHALPSAQAGELTNAEKAVTILNNVVGLDATRYSVDSKTVQQDNPVSDLGIPQENVICDLTSSGSNIKALFTFANGNLQIMQVLENQGTPIVNKVATRNTVELAKDFLSNYQSYTNNPLFDQLKLTLENVDQNENLQKLQEIQNSKCPIIMVIIALDGIMFATMLVPSIQRL